MLRESSLEAKSKQANRGRHTLQTDRTWSSTICVARAFRLHVPEISFLGQLRLKNTFGVSNSFFAVESLAVMQQID
jgi:hypothetical protein